MWIFIVLAVFYVVLDTWLLTIIVHAPIITKREENAFQCLLIFNAPIVVFSVAHFFRVIFTN